jgi:hypothetical protein
VRPSSLSRVAWPPRPPAQARRRFCCHRRYLVGPTRASPSYPRVPCSLLPPTLPNTLSLPTSPSFTLEPPFPRLGIAPTARPCRRLSSVVSYPCLLSIPLCSSLFSLTEVWPWRGATNGPRPAWRDWLDQCSSATRPPPHCGSPLLTLWRSSACGTPAPSAASLARGVVRGQPRHNTSLPWRGPARGTRRGQHPGVARGAPRDPPCARPVDCVRVGAARGQHSGAAATWQVSPCALFRRQAAAAAPASPARGQCSARGLLAAARRRDPPTAAGAARLVQPWRGQASAPARPAQPRLGLCASPVQQQPRRPRASSRSSRRPPSLRGEHRLQVSNLVSPCCMF